MHIMMRRKVRTKKCHGTTVLQVLAGGRADLLILPDLQSGALSRRSSCRQV